MTELRTSTKFEKQFCSLLGFCSNANRSSHNLCFANNYFPELQVLASELKSEMGQSAAKTTSDISVHKISLGAPQWHLGSLCTCYLDVSSILLLDCFTQVGNRSAKD